MDAKKEFYKDVDKPMPLLVDPSFLSSLVEQLSYDAKNEGETHILAASGVQYLRADFIVEMARVLAFGAEKYGANNWMRAHSTEARDIYLNALLRHVLAYARGEQHCDTDRQYHLAQIAVNAMFLFCFDKIGKAYEPTDV
jgi:hypothetical protein